MTNAQKWIALILVVFSILFLISKMTEKEDSFEGAEFYGEANETAQVQEKEVDAEALMADHKCYICHTKSLAGSGAGPDIRNVSEHWTREDLIKYLKNPKDFENDNRLAQIRSKFRSPMPGANNLSDQEVAKIADYLLNLK